MGYELHITRKAAWFDEGGPVVTLDEWDKLAAGDPDLLSENFQGRFYSDSSGNIVAKNPEKPVRAKMYQMAQRLGAKLQGDEGELYGPDGEPVDESYLRRRVNNRNLFLLAILLIVVVIVLCHLR
jgi:hypothetical protein